MSSFDDARRVEYRSMEILTPFIRARSFDGRFVLIEKGRLATELQKSVGDAMLTGTDGKLWAVEVKAEESNRHQNLFLETWSNLSRYTPGWMVTLNTDLLLYHFIREDELYVANFQRIKEWAFKSREIYSYPERKQSKYDQLNDTWGRCVPIDVLTEQCRLREFKASTGEAVTSDIWEAA